MVPVEHHRGQPAASAGGDRRGSDAHGHTPPQSGTPHSYYFTILYIILLQKTV